MADSTRKLWRKALEAKLKSIEGIKSVDWQKNTNIEIPAEEMPKISIWKLPTAIEHDGINLVNVEHPVDLMVFLRGKNEVATDDEIDDIRDKIVDKLFEDIRQGVPGLYRTDWVEDFEGVHEEETIGQLRMRFVFAWKRNLRCP